MKAILLCSVVLAGCASSAPYFDAARDVGAPPPAGAIILFQGTHGQGAARAELDAKWVDWRDWPQGYKGDAWRTSTRNTSPAQFGIAIDPEFPGDTNHVTLRTEGATGPVGRWGYDDIEVRPAFYHRDARLHVEWVAMEPDVNSGVYVQNRYEIQIISNPEKASIPHRHGLGSIVDEFAPTANPNRPEGKWQAYDIEFRAARWRGDSLLEPARMSVWWNGVRVHDNRAVTGIATGLKNTSGEPVTPAPLGLKLQREKGDVRFRNIWMQRLEN